LWPREYATELVKCNKRALVEEEAFLRYLVLPMLKQKLESNAIYNIGKTILFENQYSLVSRYFKSHNFETILRHLDASGVVAYLSLDEEN